MEDALDEEDEDDEPVELEELLELDEELSDFAEELEPEPLSDLLSDFAAAGAVELDEPPRLSVR